MDSILALPPSPPPPTSPMCSLVRRATLQLSNCDAHDLTLLALGLAVLGPTLTRGWVRRFEAALQRQPTSLDPQLQVCAGGGEVWGVMKIRIVLNMRAPMCGVWGKGATVGS